MTYRIVLEGFQKECERQDEASGMVLMLINAGIYYINADEVRKGKGIKKPTIFVKGQTIDADNLVAATTILASIASALKDFEVDPEVKLITIQKN